MTLGERLLKLRKDKNLSQEEVANILNVTRQTVSKWELDQSLPDFDKIVPLCKLYEISTDELLTGNKKEEVVVEKTEDEKELEKRKKRTLGLVIGILLYFAAIIMGMIQFENHNLYRLRIIGFLTLFALATCVIIYSQNVYKKEKKIKQEDNKLLKQLSSIVTTVTVIIYLFVSITTMAWHLTWIIFIINWLVIKIIELVIGIRNGEYEK